MVVSFLAGVVGRPSQGSIMVAPGEIQVACARIALQAARDQPFRSGNFGKLPILPRT